MKTRILLSGFVLCANFIFAQSYDSLDINNIHAGFNAAGDLFYNINTGNGHIHSPGNKIQYSIANLWVGGMDANNQLHVAAQTYRQTGTDFWPGPLDTTNVICYTAVSAAWNRIWKLNCAEVDSFAMYNSGTPAAGYSVPLAIQDWPGNGDAASGQAHFMAPFTDVDGDQQYNWAAGDYPEVRGNQSLFYVYNDALIGHTHTETSGQPLGIEIQAMPYAFDYPLDNAIMNTIFIHYKIINRSTLPWNTTRIGFWSDFDLSSTSTKSGSDSLLGAYYYYGSDNAAGVVFLNTPMSGCISYNNSAYVTGNPSSTQHYYNYLNQIWKDGTPLTSGNGGYGGVTPTSWMYNGDPVTNTGWNDNSPIDKRLLGTTNSFLFQPGMTYTFDVAIVFASDSTNATASVTLLKQYIQQVKSFYQGQSPICSPYTSGIHQNILPENTISVLPNPVNSAFTLQTSSTKLQSYFIYDVAGKEVMNGKTSGTQTVIGVQELQSGMYFIRVGSDDQVQTLRFVKADE